MLQNRCDNKILFGFFAKKIMKKKLWKKPTTVMFVDYCKVCQKEITNDQSFLAFLNKTYSHFDCDRANYIKQQQEKDA